MRIKLERCTLHVPICISVVLLSGCFQEDYHEFASPLDKSTKTPRISQFRHLKKDIKVKHEGVENKFKESKIAGEHVLVRDVSKSMNFIINESDPEHTRLNPDPDSFPKTSPRKEVFDIESLLKYHGLSSEKESIKEGQARFVWGATEMNYRTIDILLSALKIPFVIDVLGGSLGNGWSSEGRLTVIVDSHNYREAAKVLIAAAKHGAIEVIIDDF